MKTKHIFHLHLPEGTLEC